jgi:hypothetical protein
MAFAFQCGKCGHVLWKPEAQCPNCKALLIIPGHHTAQAEPLGASQLGKPKTTWLTAVLGTLFWFLLCGGCLYLGKWVGSRGETAADEFLASAGTSRVEDLYPKMSLRWRSQHPPDHLAQTFASLQIPETTQTHWTESDYENEHGSEQWRLKGFIETTGGDVVGLKLRVVKEEGEYRIDELERAD